MRRCIGKRQFAMELARRGKIPSRQGNVLSRRGNVLSHRGNVLSRRGNLLARRGQVPSLITSTCSPAADDLPISG